MRKTTSIFGHCIIVKVGNFHAEFILSLEKMENFYEKSGKDWDIQGVFYNFYQSQTKVSENELFG